MFDPQYTLTNQILNSIAEIERLTATIKRIGIPTEILKHIKKQCSIALTHYSTQIEGNRLSMEQVSQVLEKQKTFGLIRDEKEVKNYFSLLEKMPSFIKKYKKKITQKLILTCHNETLNKIVEKNLRGRFRDAQNAIYEAGSGKLIYLPPEPKDVTKLIENLCQWINKANIHAIILAAIFHNEFVTIHPFIDGNGRMARFLSLYFLESHDLDWKHIVPIDRYYADNRPIYYEMLQQNYSHNYYEDRNKTDFTKWIEYYVEGIKIMLSGTINQVELFKTENILINNRQAKILNYLKNKNYITASQYAQKYKISNRMASIDLTQLVKWGKLSIIGKARATKYFLK